MSTPIEFFEKHGYMRDREARLREIASDNPQSLSLEAANQIKHLKSQLEIEGEKVAALLLALKKAQDALAHCTADIGYAPLQTSAAIAINEAVVKANPSSPDL